MGIWKKNTCIEIELRPIAPQSFNFFFQTTNYAKMTKVGADWKKRWNVEKIKKTSQKIEKKDQNKDKFRAFCDGLLCGHTIFNDP